MNSQTNALLAAISELLVLMIESGAEIYRVEETAKRTLEVYGMKQIDIYATTSNIILSVETPDGSIKTHTRRVKNTGINIEKVHQLNNLSRKIVETKPNPLQIKNELDKIQSAPKYPNFISVIFYGLIGGAFYLFFGGRTIIDLLIAIAIGLITGLMVFLLEKSKANKFLIKFLCSFCACLLAITLQKIGPVTNADHIIIGNIMTLIPGTGLTNSIRDLFTGDSISGVLRLIEAALLALAIACGYIVSVFILGGVA